MDLTGKVLIAGGRGFVSCINGGIIHECANKEEAEKWIEQQGAIVYQSPKCPECGKPCINGQFAGLSIDSRCMYCSCECARKN